MKKALLVIDMQNVSVGKNHASYFKYDCEKLIGAVNGVIDEKSSFLSIENEETPDKVSHKLTDFVRHFISWFFPASLVDVIC
ncbi:hypothetical protein [uncultured Ligilactobacillus sp.]|uniref:hypothetical protein n=1 Tax=uncultured Ligilactobacillus sp. TaxID=2837633 RepID=UPI0025914BDA|nr:hypothetical protein [uncultured Ligilactobacillus sp.]